jgi:hypothetical protein
MRLVGYVRRVPQCQRSENNTILAADLHEMAPGVWVCPGAPYSPGCPGGEIYADATRGPLAERCLFFEGLERCSIEFDRQPSSAPRLWLGVSPRAIGNADGSIDIYLAAGSNDLQYRFQCGQEVFHAVCGPATMHWTHELLSIHFALRHLEAEGDAANVAAQKEFLRSTACAISTSELLGWLDWPKYPPVDIYGRVFILGEQLINATSWEDVKRLISADSTEWLGTLDTAKRARVEAVFSQS